MNNHKVFNIEEVKNFQIGDVVYLYKWQNLKNGEKRFTTSENCIVAGQNEKWITFRNLSSYCKDCKIEEYGETWSLGVPLNSYSIA